MRKSSRDRFQLHNVGPINDLSMELGSFTLLTGPQATGKTLSLQTIKLLSDHARIKQLIKKQGYDWYNQREDFLNLYYGEGMSNAFGNKDLKLFLNREISLDEVCAPTKSQAQEKVFYIPAQRVNVIRNGWPRAFSDFSREDPFVVRQFSEHLRLLMEAGLGRENSVFPHPKRFKQEYRTALDESIFSGGVVIVDNTQSIRRIMLAKEEMKIPFMLWSTGQREVMPLLLGLYWLMPPAGSAKKGAIKHVIIEEPEMGLHPDAINSLMLLFLELVSRGYHLVVSTHHPHLVELAWMFKLLQRSPKPRVHLSRLQQLFGIEAASPNVRRVFENVFSMDLRAYYMEKDSRGLTRSRDISSLDLDGTDEATRSWGGIIGHSSKINEFVAGLGDV
jgi:energy-coupling factor transporter ATP-binding protein EcfA2